MPNLRLALLNYAHSTVTAKLQVDKLTIEELPPAVTLEPLKEVGISGMRLEWSQYTGQGFQCYKVYRHTAQGVDETHTLLTTITDPAQTTFADSQLVARTRYFYKVYTYNENDTGTPSNEASAQTTGVPLGWSDDFENGLDPAWTVSGTWGVQADAGVDGGAALTDSPGDYANSSDTWAQTAVDLSTAEWPVLVFKDRYTLPCDGDNAYLEIGAADNNNIASIAWTTVYSVREARSTWREQQIDLSRWKGRHTVYIRFRLGTNGSIVDDGWAIDDVNVREHTPLVESTAIFEDFETGMDAWLNGGWSLRADAPYEGDQCLVNHESQLVQANTDSWLVYGGELDLSGASQPKVTLWAKGLRGDSNYGRLYVLLSKDGGTTWQDISGIMPVATEWGRHQFTVPASHQVSGVRLAIQSFAYRYTLDSKYRIDALGVGGEAPSAPTLATPAAGATVTVVRPALSVVNATDYQRDLLTYSFEVYSSAAMEPATLVAQNAAIASGVGVTTWQVDVDLADEARYWWRCRATDVGANVGAWSETGTFYVGLVNTPPEAPMILTPYADATLPDASHYFIWLASADPDIGDRVTGYEIEIAADSAFIAPLVRVAVAPGQSDALLSRLNSLAGYEALELNNRYHWRVRALDIWDEPSEWSAATFIYGTLQEEEPPSDPEPVTITGISIEGGMVRLSWTESEHPVRVEYTEGLTAPQWLPVSGAANVEGNEIRFPHPAVPTAFFRVVIGDQNR